MQLLDWIEETGRQRELIATMLAESDKVQNLVLAQTFAGTDSAQFGYEFTSLLEREAEAVAETLYSRDPSYLAWKEHNEYLDAHEPYAEEIALARA